MMVKRLLSSAGLQVGIKCLSPSSWGFVQVIQEAEVLTPLLHHYLRQYHLHEKRGLTRERDTMVLYCSAISSLSHTAPNTH